jgi:hypothetical protein
MPKPFKTLCREDFLPRRLVFFLVSPLPTNAINHERCKPASKRYSSFKACNRFILFYWILADVLDKPGPFEFVLAETASVRTAELSVGETWLSRRAAIEVEAMRGILIDDRDP